MAERIFNDVPVMIPGLRFMDSELLDDEPWKELVPVYYLGKEKPTPYSIFCQEFKYFMTDSRRALEEELDRYGLKMPDFSEFRPNPALAHSVRIKMAELNVCWALAKKAGPKLINYYTEEEGAYFFTLNTKESR